MNNLIAYYQKELNFLKKQGKVFANRFPKIARRLGLVEGESEDPHVSRLIESFALLTSRIHQRLDNDMPKVIDALLSTLAPQFLRPLPSVCIAMLSPDPLKSSLTGKNILPKETTLFTRQSSLLPCQFQTVYPVTLLPLSLRNAAIHFNSDELKWQLQLRFQVWPSATLANESIRLYLHGSDNATSTLYTLLCSEISRLELHYESVSIPLNSSAIRPVGFDAEEALLTREPRISPVHILLLDYFWFPQKFSFIDIQLPSGFSVQGNDTFELQAQFQRNPLTERLEMLAPLVDEQFFRLHCTPAVNLFAQQAEPIALTEAVAEYPVVPDTHRNDHTEVWAIQNISVQRKVGNSVESLPVPSLLEIATPIEIINDSGLRWQSFHRKMDGLQDQQYQTSVAFCQLHPNDSENSADIASIHLLCSNGELPHNLQYGHPEGDFDADVPVAGLKIAALTHPTRPVNPPVQSAAHCRFLSQLSLNYQLLDDKYGAQRLIETLTLYNFDDNSGKARLLSLIKDLQCEPITARLTSDDPHSLARGVSLTLTFAHSARQESEYFLLCNLLDRLLALYSPVNSFTRLTTRIEHDEQTQRIWPIRAGRLSWL